MGIITLTKHPQPVVGSERPEAVAGGSDDEIEVTPAMIRAGENVLDRAFDRAGLPPSWAVFSSVRDVYTAMVRSSGR